MQLTFPISLFTNRTRTPLSKNISLDAAGSLVKQTGGLLTSGQVETLELHSLEELATTLASLPAHKAAGFGVCGFPQATVLTKKALFSATGGSIPVIARDRDHFRWPIGLGVLFLDYDPDRVGTVLTPEQIIELLRRAVPELRTIDIGWKPSASSFVFDDAGKAIQGLSGQHFFILVEQASEIPAIGALISARLWLAGEGRITISGAGRLLERTMFDQGVWQPERLVFGRASCGPNLRQDFPPIKMFVGASNDGGDRNRGILRSGQLLALSSSDLIELDRLKAVARREAELEARRARGIWLDCRAAEAAGATANDREVEAIRSAMAAALVNEVLPPELILRAESGERPKVADLLNDPEHWDGQRFADPLEPDYQDDPRIAIAMLKGGTSPFIYSHAHGGVRYRLTADRKVDCSAKDFADLVANPAKFDRFRVIPAAEFAAAEPPSWLVKSILPRRALAMVYGASGSGKTFFVLDLAWAISRGTSWNGRKTTAGKVIYIVAEGVAGCRNRLNALAEYHGISLTEVEIGLIQDCPDLRKDWGALLSKIEEAGGGDLIVIDTLAQVTAGADENAGADMGAVIERCNFIVAWTNATVLLVHHSGKDPARGARGWSGMRGALDTEIEVKKGEGGRFAARITKQKDGSEGAAFTFELTSVHLGVDEDSDPISSCVIQHVEGELPLAAKAKGKWQLLIKQVLEGLEDFGPVPEEQLLGLCTSEAEHQKLGDGRRTRDQVKRALDNLVSRSVLSRSEAGVVSHNSTTAPQLNKLGEGLLALPTPHHPKGWGVVGDREAMWWSKYNLTPAAAALLG